MDEVQQAVDPDTRLPALPFRAPTGVLDICQYSNAIEGSFGPVLQSLVDSHGDSSVSLVVLDPSPQYYRRGYGSFPAFRVPGSGLSDAYWDLVAHEPEDDPTGAVIYTADVVAIVGSSGQWSVWGERSWDLAIVLSQIDGGPWLTCGVPFVPVEAALADFTMPDFKRPLPDTERSEFLRNIRERGWGSGV
ncbi:hypothetical protein ACFSEO_13355 [Agromyces cerinus subsp. nitratus]|uniref:hypothetical protein n=1 Tax=Agromyces cerinus TaxID=33878 RepID=UPI003630D0E9